MNEIRNHLDALRAAHEQYLALLATVQRITNSNPQGLQPRPMFGQTPTQPRLQGEAP